MELLQKLSEFLKVYEIHKNTISDECKDMMWELFPYALMVHKQIVDNSKQGCFENEKIVVPKFSVERYENLFLLDRLIEYVNVINQNNTWTIVNKVDRKKHTKS